MCVCVVRLGISCQEVSGLRNRLYAVCVVCLGTSCQEVSGRAYSAPTSYLPTYLPAGAMAQAKDSGRAAAAVDAATVPVPDSSSEASADEYPVPLSAPTVFRPPALQAQCLPTVSAPLSAPIVSVLQRHGGRPSHHPHCQLIHKLIQDQLRAQETQQPQTSEPVILFPWPQRLECLMRPPFS